MAIFGSNNNYDDLDTLVCEGYDAEVNGSVDAIIESYDDQLAIMEAIHKMDMEELEMKKEGKDDEEIGEALEASMSDTWQKIKEALAKLLAKIKAWFESVIRYFESHFKSTEKFLDKYEKDLLKLDLSGYTYKMFEYSNMDKIVNDVTSGPAATLKEIDKMVNMMFTDFNKDNLDKVKEIANEEFDKARGSLLGKSKVEAGEFSKEAYKFFRGGAEDASDKKEISVNIKSIIDDLRKAAKLIPAIKNAKKDNENETKKTIARVKSAEAEALRAVKDDKQKSDNITSAARLTVQITQTGLSIALSFLNSAKTACSELVSTYTAVCRGAFSYKKDSK